MGQFDAFISYSHAGDGNLAPAIQSGLQRLAKRPFQRRALHVFRDETGLSANPHLWSSIEEALDSSAWFVLLASPEAANSEWVNREVATWIERKSVDTCLVVVTEGTLSFGPAQRVDDSTDCLPPALVDTLSAEPRWLDLRWARQEEQLDLRNGRFRAAIADLAAPIHGIAKDELESDDVRQQRAIKRLAVAGVATMSLLAVGATALAVAAVAQSNRANAEAERATAETTRANDEADRANGEATRATARSLASQAAALSGIDVDLSLLLAAEGYKLDPSIDTRAGLLTALEGARLFSDLDPNLPDDISDLEMSADRSTLYVLSKDGQITAHNADSLEQRGEPLLSGIEEPSVLHASSDGSRLAFAGGAGVGVLDLDTGDVVSEGLGDYQAVPELNSDGSRVAVAMISEPTVRIYDVDAAIVTHEIPTEFGAPAFVDDGRLAISEYPPVLKVYDITGDEAVETGVYDTGVLGGSAILSPDGTRLIVGGLEGSAVLLDTATFEPTAPPFRSRGSRTGDFFFNSDGTLVGMSSDDGSVTIIDTSNGTEVTTMAGLTGSLVSVFVTDATVVSTSWTHTGSAVWAVQGEPAIGRSQPAGLVGVLGLRLLGQGSDAALLGTFGTMTIAPVDDVRVGTVTQQVNDIARAFDVSETAGVAAAYVLEIDEEAQMGRARKIEIIRLDDLSSVITIDVDDRPVNNLAFDSTGERLAVGSEDGDLTVYEATTGDILHGPVRVDQLAALGLLVWSADGSRLHTGGQDGVLRTFDTETWVKTDETTLVGSLQALRLATLSSDGSTIVVPAESGEVFLVEERTGELQGRPLISAGTQLQRAVLTDDGRTVAVISRDGTLRLFDVDTGRAIGPTLTGHFGLSLSLELAPAGHLVSGGVNDDRVIQWDLDPDAWLERACALAGRDLTQQEWSDYVGGDYRQTCTNLPAGD